MLNEHTLDQLRSLRLDGMVRAIDEQATSTAGAELSSDDRLTLLVQREVAWRDDRRVARLLKAAKLKIASACIEDKCMASESISALLRSVSSDSGFAAVPCDRVPLRINCNDQAV